MIGMVFFVDLNRTKSPMDDYEKGYSKLLKKATLKVLYEKKD